MAEVVNVVIRVLVAKLEKAEVTGAVVVDELDAPTTRSVGDGYPAYNSRPLSTVRSSIVPVMDDMSKQFGSELKAPSSKLTPTQPKGFAWL